MRNRNATENLSLWLIGLMGVLPFLSPHHQLPIPSFYSEILGAALGLAAMVALLKKDVWQPFTLPEVALLPAGLLAILLLQVFLGMLPYPQMALIGMEYLLWAMLLIVLGQRLRTALGAEAMARTLAWCLLVGGLLGALMALLQQFGFRASLLFPTLPAQSSFGNLGQPNHFANYTALAIASGLYLMARRCLPLMAFGASAIFLLTALGLSASRSSWLYLLLFAALAGGYHRVHRNAQSRRMLIATLVFLPIFGLLQMLTHQLLIALNLNAPIQATERLLANYDSPSRLTLWRDALQMWLQHPVLGVGFGQFPWHSYLLIENHTPIEFSQPAEHPHNLLMQLLAEMGLFSFFLLAWAAWRWISGALRESLTAERCWCWMLLGVLGTHSMLEYPLWYTYFLGIAAVLLGMGETRTLRPDFSRIGRPAMAAVLLMGSLGLAGLTQSYAELERWVDRAMRHQIADSELPAVNAELLRLHRESMLTPYVELMYAIALTPDKNQLESQLALTSAAIRFAPVSEVIRNYTVLLALAGNSAEATRQLRIAEKINKDESVKTARILESIKTLPSGRQQKTP